MPRLHRDAAAGAADGRRARGGAGRPASGGPARYARRRGFARGLVVRAGVVVRDRCRLRGRWRLHGLTPPTATRRVALEPLVGWLWGTGHVAGSGFPDGSQHFFGFRTVRGILRPRARD